MDRNAPAGVVAIAALSAALSATFYLAVTTGGFGAALLGYLAPLPIFMVGFWAGATAAALAGIFGAMLTAVFTGSEMAPLTFLATAALPAALATATGWRRVARREADGAICDVWAARPGDAVMALTGAAAAAFFVAALWFVGDEGGLKGALGRALATIVAQLSGLGQGPGQTPGGVAESVDALAAETAWLTPGLPGFIAVSWLLMTAVNAALAQGTLTRFGLMGRPQAGFADLALPRWTAAVFGGAVAAALGAPDPFGFWGLNLAMILGAPLLFAGLAVVHAFAEGKTARPVLLVAFYVFLFVFGWPIALMIGLGVIETWTALSRRLRARRLGMED